MFRKTDSKMDGRETLRKSVVMNTVLSPEERTIGLSYLPTEILRRGKIVKFESNTTCVFSQMNGLHVSGELTDISSDSQHKTNNKELF